LPSSGISGNIYSGSRDRSVRVWSGASGAHVRTLEWHTRCVSALAIFALGSKIYSASTQSLRLDRSTKSIRVWASSHMQTRAATCRLEQPHADSSSHMQTRAATCRLEQPHADSSSHMRTRAATCGLEQPHADSSSHMQTLVVHTCGSVRLPLASTVPPIRVHAIRASACGLATAASPSTRSLCARTLSSHSRRGA
jgi:WD40 repeat protein